MKGSELTASLNEIIRQRDWQNSHKLAPSELSISDRWDVRKATTTALSEHAKQTRGLSNKGVRCDGLSILQGLNWCTLCPVEDAMTDDRPLTDDEWNAIVIPVLVDGPGQSTADWTLLHPSGGLLPNSNPFPMVSAMPPRSTVRDVLEAVSHMTVTKGVYQIADSVYWEGLKLVDESRCNVLMRVNLGS